MKLFKKITSLILSLLLLSTLFSYIPCNAAAFLPGDVTSDGKITAEDARLILRNSVGCCTFTKAQLRAADINSDNSVSAADARLALLFSIGFYHSPFEINGTSVKLTGFTENGYPVYNADGVTYIDGIIIANKTYSLPESYNPGDLLNECKSAFNKMKSAAAAKGLSIYISSGFRSFSSQKSIYNRYVSNDGRALADTYSARPGHSEHQTGLSIDLNTITQAFGKTKEGKWVAEHCHEYGFIIRYPEGKAHITGYQYEPWHLRYVGVEAATKIAKSGLCLEEYYGITSTYK